MVYNLEKTKRLPEPITPPIYNQGSRREKNMKTKTLGRDLVTQGRTDGALGNAVGIRCLRERGSRTLHQQRAVPVSRYRRSATVFPTNATSTPPPAPRRTTLHPPGVPAPRLGLLRSILASHPSVMAKDASSTSVVVRLLQSSNMVSGIVGTGSSASWCGGGGCCCCCWWWCWDICA